jgi:hypothetical protein
MKVQFADSFGDSLKTLIRHQSWWYKTYEVIRYKIPAFLKNIYRFRKMLWNHRWYDYRYTLEALQTSIKIMEKGMHNGNEVPESRNKKIAKMQRAVELLDHIMNDDYIDRVELELGPLVLRDWEFEEVEAGVSRLIENETKAEKAHNRKVFQAARNLEEKEWRELWNIFKGQSNLDWNKLKKTLKPEEVSTAWDKWYNGADMRGWWD